MTSAAVTARLHALVPRSRANGPGERTVIWFQGCTLACPGCFNPTTHAADVGMTVDVADLIEGIGARFVAGEIEGVTISGGEPFQQMAALARLVAGIRQLEHGGAVPSVLVFSGYSLAELRPMPGAAAILDAIDVLIDGRYVAGARLGRELRGSHNQTAHLLSARYTLEAIAATPELEVQIAADGSVAMTGVAPIATGQLTRRRG